MSDDGDEEKKPEPLVELEKRAEWIQSLAVKQGTFESPIDIDLNQTCPLDLYPLVWYHMDLPSKKMMIRNTGYTLLLSCSWHAEKPYITGGPFLGNYQFSQLHFHWGPNPMEGSEHTIDGGQQPMELHVVFYNSLYPSQERALHEKDGVMVVAYLFRLQTKPNPAIKILEDQIRAIQLPHCQARLNTLPLEFLIREFNDDYFMYWGCIQSGMVDFVVLWLLCREPLGIAAEQIESFRALMNFNDQCIVKNFRQVKPIGNRKVFHVSPSPSRFSTLIPISRDQQLCHQNYIYGEEEELPN